MARRHEKSIFNEFHEEIDDSGKWQKFLDKISRRFNKANHQNDWDSDQQINKSDSNSDDISSYCGRDLFLEKIENSISSDKSRIQLLSICKHNSTLEFCAAFPENPNEEMVRIDSGSYAEVFRAYNAKTQRTVIFKVIRAVSNQIKKQIRGPDFIATEKFDEIVNEVRMSSALSDLNYSIFNDLGQEFKTQCFPIVYYTYLVEGDIPQHFLKEHLSDKLTPIRKDPFEEFVDIPREYAVIVMSNGGKPLWKLMKYREVDANQLVSALKQVTFGLAVAEAIYEFEHRDLHISNILLKSTEKIAINYIYQSISYEIESLGYEAVIIDTTFSRIKIGNEIYYKNMSDILRYEDPNEKLTSQDRVYKCMVDLTKNKWKNFTPKTNIYWLVYLYKNILNTSIINECHEQQPKETIRQMILIIEKCQTLHEFVTLFFFDQT